MMDEIDLLHITRYRNLFSPKQGRLLRLYFIEGLTYEQVGRVYGVCPERARTMIWQTISRKLRRHIRFRHLTYEQIMDILKGIRKEQKDLNK